MRTTLNIDDDLLQTASELTGERQKAALVRMGLEALIAQESGKRLARLGGTEPQLEAAPPRRPRARGRGTRTPLASVRGKRYPFDAEGRANLA